MLTRFIATAFIVALAISFGGGSALALDKVKVGKSGVGMAWSVIEGGQDAKIWESEGIDVTAIQFNGDAVTQRALTSGDIDFGFGSGPGMGYRVKGVPAIAVAAIGGPPYPFVIVVGRDSPIRTTDDLKGKSVGITTAGSLTQWLVRELSRQKGWGPTGIRDLPLGSDRARLAAIKTGDLDGAVTTLEQAYSYEENNEARLLVTFGDIVKDFHTHVLFARDELVQNNPDLVQRFVRAWFKSVAYMRAHKAFGIKIAAKTIDMSESAVSRAYDIEIGKMLSTDGAFNPKAIDVIRGSLVALGILDKVPDAKDLYTDRFVPVKF
jgi:NitT/TauT family transport system substrate-binding protein